MRRNTVFLAMAVSVIISGCSGGNTGRAEYSETGVTAESMTAAQTEAKTINTVTAVSQHTGEAASGTLIAYFTWADNTVVENQEAAVQSALAHYDSIGDSSRYTDVDAVSSASVVQPGNVAQMAGWIQQEIGGDLYSIQVKEPYSSDYDECMDRASKERADQARPELIGQVENLDAYDTVMIGYPNWWSGVPMPVLSFIENNNLSGKKIILFCSHGTGGLARSVREITEELPADCSVEENVLGIYRADIPGGQPKVQEWLTEIGY
ncbi:flavodoxin [Enterocloster clostridioformis]|jgi:flavodoxin|uniref:flavodoxin n=1 Tax=Enterocloster clostridioformis TaxID=1531 RepID=UPI001FAA3A8A|nr:flavodoxin [Enterocloster clostridioformis]